MKRMYVVTGAVVLVLLAGAAIVLAAPAAEKSASEPDRTVFTAVTDKNISSGNLETAIFAGGCFWSVESAFEKVYGVEEAVSGYTGGTTENPTYDNYVRGGHVEAVRVIYAPDRVRYEDLLEVFWRSTNPTDPGGQFYDRGPGYRPVLFWRNETERRAAEESKRRLASSGVFSSPIAVELRRAGEFYPAEDYHQDYARKNPEHYESYRIGSGRDEYFKKVWGATAGATPAAPPQAEGAAWVKPDGKRLSRMLSPISFQVTQQEGTEAPFDNEYWDNHRTGIYVDIVSGEPLFSSRDKYDSRTGWPSFTRALVPANIVLETDDTLGMLRVEVRSRYADSHLGHLFDDGPAPTGLRYCMNSASLRFIPIERMEAEGYGAFLKYFPEEGT